jgi:hypothetical protein
MDRLLEIAIIPTGRSNHLRPHRQMTQSGSQDVPRRETVEASG